MINSALSGGLRKIYLNEEKIKSALDENNLPKMLADSFDMNLMQTVADHIHTLLKTSTR